jgi:hypothetical protein
MATRARSRSCVEEFDDTDFAAAPTAGCSARRKSLSGSFQVSSLSRRRLASSAAVAVAGKLFGALDEIQRYSPVQ